jgi:hypothetical protein
MDKLFHKVLECQLKARMPLDLTYVSILIVHPYKLVVPEDALEEQEAVVQNQDQNQDQDQDQDVLLEVEDVFPYPESVFPDPESVFPEREFPDPESVFPESVFPESVLENKY